MTRLRSRSRSRKRSKSRSKGKKPSAKVFKETYKRLVIEILSQLGVNFNIIATIKQLHVDTGINESQILETQMYLKNLPKKENKKIMTQYIKPYMLILKKYGK